MKSQLVKIGADIHRLTRHMILTTRPLSADLDFALAEWQKNKENQFWRRVVTRCLFALLEAVLWNMKKIVPQTAQVSGVQLSNDDLEAVNEERIVVTNGRSERKRRFLPLKDNMKA